MIQSKANYDDLLKKKNESKMATSMELRATGEQIQCHRSTQLSGRPDVPNRLKILRHRAWVSGLALVATVVVGTFEFMTTCRLTAKELRKNVLFAGGK